MIGDHDTVRSAEQVGLDLAKAFQISPNDVCDLRHGILPASSFQPLLRKVIEPLLKSAALTLGPLFIAAYFESSSNHTSLSDGLLTIFASVADIKGVAETNGWFRTVLYFVGGLGLLGFGAYFASRIPIDLFADVLAKRVRMAEGRVTTREEEKHVAGKRDEVIQYFFDMKERSFQVSRAAFQAIDEGGLYRVYYLPRSLALACLEPAECARKAEELERRRETTSLPQESI